MRQEVRRTHEKQAVTNVAMCGLLFCCHGDETKIRPVDNAACRWQVQKECVPLATLKQFR